MWLRTSGAETISTSFCACRTGVPSKDAAASATATIVARKDNAVHFVEVKYRRTTAYGAGYDFINYEKANRLTRAALAWCQAHYYQGDYQIDALSLSGPSDNLKIVYIPSILC